MHWDALVYTVRCNEERKEEIEKELLWLRRCSLFSSTLLLVVEDPCKDIGSGGSTLNALLVVTERLCSARGYTVLNEDVLLSSKILIIHSSEHNSHSPLGSGFVNMGRFYRTPHGHSILEMPIVHLIDNLGVLAENEGANVWVAGTDMFWKMEKEWLEDGVKIDKNGLNVFTFQVDDETAREHGTYTFDAERRVTDLHYRNPPQRSYQPLILALLCLPPCVSRSLLSLHSLHPLTASTYYGIDNGAIGFKLSLFFDFVQATCTSVDQFIKSPIIPDKCDLHSELLQLARRLIHERLGKYSTRGVFLPIGQTHYFRDNEENFEKFSSFCDKEFMTQSFKTLCLKELDRRLRTSNLPVQYPKSTSNYSWDPSFLQYLKPLTALGTQSMDEVLRELHQLFSPQPCPYSARLLSLISTTLSLYANGEGGVRSGPAGNPEFAPALEKLKNKHTRADGLNEMFTVLTKWTNHPTRMIRAARHFEAAAQIFTTEEVVEVCRHFIPNLVSPPSAHSLPSSVSVSVSARIDLYGGWLDTPPITLETKKSAVINMAIKVDGKHPLRCSITRQDAEGVGIPAEMGDRRIKTVEEILGCYNRPTMPGALICACLVATGLVNPSSSSEDLATILRRNFGANGLSINCESALPHGSGLGTSSILAGAILAALWTAMGIQFSTENISHTVLYVEQLLTTGGGWQDAIGGCYPGCKVTHYRRKTASSPAHLEVENIPLPAAFETELNRRLLMIYTGKTRLAKNLLQEVIRSWEIQDSETVRVISQMEEGIEKVVETMKRGIFPTPFVEEYFEAKKVLATGSEPDSVRDLIKIMKEQRLIETAWLAGAGGGGFLYVWMTKDSKLEDVRNFLEVNKDVFCNFTVHSCIVDNDPMMIESK